MKMLEITDIVSFKISNNLKRIYRKNFERYFKGTKTSRRYKVGYFHEDKL